MRGYFSQMWNYMDITMLALYTAAYAIEGVIYTKVTLLFSHTPQAKGNISMGGCVQLRVFLILSVVCVPLRERRGGREGGGGGQRERERENISTSGCVQLPVFVIRTVRERGEGWTERERERERYIYIYT